MAFCKSFVLSTCAIFTLFFSQSAVSGSSEKSRNTHPSTTIQLLPNIFISSTFVTRSRYKRHNNGHSHDVHCRYPEHTHDVEGSDRYRCLNRSHIDVHYINYRSRSNGSRSHRYDRGYGSRYNHR